KTIEDRKGKLHAIGVGRQQAIRSGLADDAIVPEGADVRQALGAYGGDRLPGRAQLLVGRAEVGSIAQGARRGRRLIEREVVGNGRRQRVGELDRGVEREVQRSSQIEVRSITLVARRDQLRTDKCQL